MNSNGRVTLTLSKAAVKSSMFIKIKLHGEAISSPLLGSELKFLWLKLHCLKAYSRIVRIVAPQIESAVSFQHWDRDYGPFRDIGSLIICAPIGYTSGTSSMRGERSNREPKGIKPFQLSGRLRRIRRTLGSTRKRTESITRSVPDGVDGGIIVPPELSAGRVPELVSENIRDKSSVGLLPENPSSILKEEEQIAALALGWKLHETRARGVEIPRTFTKLVNKCKKDKTCKISNIYQILLNPNIIDLAYHKIKSNPGNMTQGSTNLTLNGWGYESVLKLTDKLRDESFQFSKAREVQIPKSNGGKRSLKIASPRDKIVQQAMLFILEAIYEPSFSKQSFGFRKGIGCHDALYHIKQKFQASRWFIEGDISKCFDEIDHATLIAALRDRIKDEKFIRLIYKTLNAGYLDIHKIPQTCLIGTPQGSIISPILCNVYMDSFDSFVEKELIGHYNKKTKRDQPPEYSRLMTKARYWQNKFQRTQDPKDKELAISLRKNAQKLPSINPEDPGFRRLYFIRYADDWLIGFAGPYQEAKEIRTKCKEFLARKKLRLNNVKTKITKASEGCIFLGTKIHVPLNQERFKKSSRFKSRANLGVRLNAPLLRVINKLHINGFCQANGFPLPKMVLYATDKDEIINTYISVYRGILSYYSFADNYPRLAQSLFSILRNSAAKVLAAKFKLRTVRQTLLKFGKYLGKAKEDVKIPDPKTSSLRGLKFKAGGKAKSTIKTITQRASMSLSSKNLACSACGSTFKVEMHHIRHLKDLNKKSDLISRTMAARKRKQIPLCQICHMRKHKQINKIKPKVSHRK